MHTHVVLYRRTNTSRRLLLITSAKDVTLHYITYKYITRPTCQFASGSGALRWRQNDYT